MCAIVGEPTFDPAETKSQKALQNTGPPDFRQSYFVATRYTHGYSSWFLSVTA